MGAVPDGPRFAEGELGTWACLGSLTDRSVRVWLRDVVPRARIASIDVGGETVAQAAIVPDRDHDGIGAVDLVLDRPRPGAPFTVRLGDLARTARFAPRDGAPAGFTFAFGSCHQPFEQLDDGQLVPHARAGIYPQMARVLEERRAQFLLLIGDQIYSDGVPEIQVRQQMHERAESPSDAELLARYRQIYRGYFNQAGFRALLERWPSYMIWDDHDIFDGWGSLLDRDDLDLRLYRAAARAYREYQHLHNSGTAVDDEPPYCYRFWFGDVGFFVPDLRSLRDYRAGVLLGREQWQAFDDFLQEADERVVPTLFFVATVPVAHFPPLFDHLLSWLPTARGTDVRDRWCAGPHEDERNGVLDRLLSWQTSRPERQAFLLSGDVHVGAAFSIERPGQAGMLQQWTSSPLTTRSGLIHQVTNAVGTSLPNLGEHRYRFTREAYEKANNFGLVELEPLREGGHRVSFSLYAFDQRRQALHESVRLVKRPRADQPRLTRGR